MANLQTTSYVGANLMLGRNPVIAAALPDPETYPAQTGGGIAITGGATLAQVGISCRENPFGRTCYYGITTVDLEATYSVFAGAGSVSYDADAEGPANLAELLAGIAAAINADGTLGDLVTATAADYDGDGVNDSVRLVGKAIDSYSFDGSATGSAVLSLHADAESCTVIVYGRTICNPPTGGAAAVLGSARLRLEGWHALPRPIDGAINWSVGWEGYLSTLWPVNGLDAVQPVLGNVIGQHDDGDDVIPVVQAFVASCVQESTE